MRIKKAGVRVHSIAKDGEKGLYHPLHRCLGADYTVRGEYPDY